MKILGSHTSPFVRVVRVLCEEIKCDYEMELIPPFAKMTHADIKHVKQINPLMKIPALIDENQTILDSRIIAYYLLDNKNPKNMIKKPDWEEENNISAIYGAIDAGILRFIMSSQNADLEKGYMKRSLERIESGLSYLDQRLENTDKPFGLFEISLICGLEWFDKRNIFDWSTFDNIAKIYNHHKNRDSFVKTRIPENT
tara:strand:+ start:1910 stop:2506 length:597 start_codon:yes stop_codon:yes gene_type:complete